MPFALIIVGIVLVVAATRNTQDALFALVKGDFTGKPNFLYWVVIILIVGGLGYIPALKKISTGFLVLLAVVVFVTKGDPSVGAVGGFFSKFSSALGSTSSPASATGANSSPQASTG